MIKNPVVSVLMTAYNRENYISEAIESVLASSYTNLELIIVDDCSKDNTVMIAENYAAQDNRIKVYKNERNLGDYPNRNMAASYASGEYIMYCDSDDKLFPDSIETVLKIIDKTPGFNFAMYWHHSNNRFTLSSEEALRKHFFQKQFLYMGPGGTFIRYSFFKDIGGYPVKYGPANDMYFNLKVASKSSITFVPFEFTFYRRHDGQEINNRFSYMYNNYLYMKDALEELILPFSSKELAWLKKKNKRRFVIHLFNFFRKTRDFKRTRFAYNITNFTIKDILIGIFQV